MAVVTIDASDAHGSALGGWGRYVAELVGALQAGHADGLEIDRACHTGRAPEALWEQIGLPRHARARRAAVLHSPNCFLPLRRPCPGVVTVHDLAFEAWPEDFTRRTGRKYRLLAPRAARSAERVICDSRFTADDLERRYGVAPEKVRVIPLAPALARGVGRSPEPGPFVLGVGDLRRKKDFLTLVRAWRTLREEGTPHRLVLAGRDAGEGARLRREAGGEGLSLPGYVADAELDALMREAAALVHPSRYEGFGLVMFEAMARDTPVIAARATALPETAGDGALYFAPGDARDLAHVLRTVLEDEVPRRELVARGRRRVAELSWERTARATAGVYAELIGGERDG